MDAGAGRMTGAHPVAFYLKELSGEPARRGGRSLALGPDGASELEVQIADAHARGVLEERAAARVEMETALARQQAAFDQKLASERQKWAREEGARIGMMLTEALGGIEQRLAETVSHILKPILLERVRARAVSELGEALAGLLTQGDFAKFTISGPKDLLEVIESQLGGRHDVVTLVASEAADVTIRADDAIMQTRIQAWADAIEGGAP
jgi:hypothetical protein